MFVFDSVLVSLVSVAGDGLTIVVLLSFFSVFSPPAGGVTVVFFCSQAASKAALARMHMYFFIIGLVEKSILASILYRSKRPFRFYRIRTAARISSRAPRRLLGR